MVHLRTKPSRDQIAAATNCYDVMQSKQRMAIVAERFAEGVFLQDLIGVYLEAGTRARNNKQKSGGGRKRPVRIKKESCLFSVSHTEVQ